MSDAVRQCMASEGFTYLPRPTPVALKSGKDPVGTHLDALKVMQDFDKIASQQEAQTSSEYKNALSTCDAKAETDWASRHPRYAKIQQLFDEYSRLVDVKLQADTRYVHLMEQELACLRKEGYPEFRSVLDGTNALNDVIDSVSLDSSSAELAKARTRARQIGDAIDKCDGKVSTQVDRIRTSYEEQFVTDHAAALAELAIT